MKTNNYIIDLKNLKKEYFSENVSLLIGAGFSKNVLSDFPSWNQLLVDMILELFSEKFTDNPLRIIKKSPNNTIVNKNFREQKIQEIINEVGYLEIVSLYLKKKGMREAVEIYIEERTPYADKDTGKFIIPHKNTSVDIEDSALSLHEKVLEGKWEQIYTTNYDNLLEYVADIKSKGWREIANGYDLSFSGTKKNIIKIHGSLRNNKDRFENKKFEFDGCHDHCYIITKEDYDTYSVQHEAFAQLMRISLLRGVFCLIGFSGNDPNFLSWIKWVKDILIKGQKSNSEARTKVYVITIDDKEISKELKLYYANHHICIIPLRNTDVKEEIKCSSGDTKELIGAFLQYIYESDKVKTELYNNYWRNISQTDSIDKEYLLNLSVEVGFKKDVRYQNSYLNKISFPDDNNPLTISQTKLALLALYDEQALLKYFRLEEKILENFDSLTNEYKEVYYKIKNRNNTLINSASSLLKLENDNDYYYEEILRCVFMLNFERLKVLIYAWNPKNARIINKASFIYLFEPSLSKEILLNYVNNEKDTDENKYLAIQTLNFFSDWGDKSYSTVNYENQNLEDFHDISDELFEDILDGETKIKPYGINSGNHNRSKIQESVRFLNFIIDNRPQISSKRYVSLDSSKWYQVFKHLYLSFPYPCFYFSLQFNSKDILLRIGQDFAYSDDLKKETEYFLIKSLNNIVNEGLPDNLLNSTFLICSQFLSSVLSSKWEKNFMKIWEKYIPSVFHDKYRNNEMFTFIKGGLPHLQNKNSILKIVTDCILNREKSLDNAIYFLYHLRIKKQKIDDTSQCIIDDFVNNISQPTEINIAGNIYHILNENNISTVAEKIIEFLKSNSKIEDFTLYTCSFFLKDTHQEMSLLKNYIINSNKLWYTGIKEKSASYPDSLHLSRFEKSFKWNSNEVVKIYSKLKTSLNSLLKSNHYKNDDGFFKDGHIKLMDEMLNFILKNNKALLQQKDYESTIKSLKDELQNKRGFEDINEGLLSDDSDKFLTSLNLLHKEIKENNIDSSIYQLGILVSRFLNKRKEGIDYCFEYLNYFIITYFSRKQIPTELAKSIIFGIDQYDKNTLEQLNLNVPKMSKHLISLSQAFHKKDYTSSGIEYWLKFKKDRRFN